MHVYVNVKQLGKRKNTVEKKSFELASVPVNTAQLITAVVVRQVDEYNQRLSQNDVLKYLTTEEMEDKSASGKISFDINYNNLPAEAYKATQNALLSFQDGIFRVFINDRELETLEQTILLNENDEITFIRLTMLAGRMW